MGVDFSPSTPAASASAAAAAAPFASAVKVGGLVVRVIASHDEMLSPVLRDSPLWDSRCAET